MNRFFKLIVGVFLFLIIFPILTTLLYSVINSWTWTDLYPKSIGTRGWEYLINFSGDNFKVLLYSVYLSILVMISTLLISLPAGKALAAYKFRGKRYVRILLLSPAFVPMVSIAMGVHISFLKFGLANSTIGLVLINMLPCIPYSITIMTNAFELIGCKYEDQSRVLGAGPWKTAIYVTLPMLSPALSTAGSLVFIVSFSQYFLNLLIGGGALVTFSMIAFPFIKSGDRMMASVYSVVFILAAFISLIVINKAMKRYYSSEQTGSYMEADE